MQLRALSQYHASPSDTLSRQCPFDLYNLDKYILEFEPIHLAIWTNTFNNWDKYILQFGQIHLAIWTNTFCNLYKYICAIAGRLIPVSRSRDNAHLISGPLWHTSNGHYWWRCEFELHSDHIAHVATIVSYNGDGIGIENLKSVPFWPSSSYSANMLPASGGRDRTLLCRGTHTHSPHLTHGGSGHIIRRLATAWVTHITGYSGLCLIVVYMGLQWSVT